MESMMQSDDGELDISSIAMYKPFEGLLELRVVSAYTIHFFILQFFLRKDSFLQLLVKDLTANVY